MSLLGSNIPIMSFQENAATRYSTTSRALVRFEGTPVYLNERQLSGAGNNALNVAEGRNVAVRGRTAFGTRPLEAAIRPIQ
jgi:hypothetical protein